MEEYQNQSLEKAISYCIENFSTKEATKRIIDYIKRDRELTEQLHQYNVVGRSEQLKAFLDEIANDKTYIKNDYYKNKAKRLSKSI